MTMDDIDPAILRTFRAILAEGSVTAGARALGIAQPTASQHLARLEARASGPLLDRAARPLRPTALGRDVAEAAARLLEAQALLGQRLAGTSRPDALRLGMPDSLSEIMGAECLSALSALAARTELKSGISPWLETAFARGDFDFAVDMEPFAQAANAARLPLFADPFVIVRPKAEPGATAHVGYGRTSKFGAACTAIARDLGAHDEPRYAFDSTQSLLRFVQAGYGWAVTSVLCIYQSPQALTGITVEPVRAAPARRFHLLCAEGTDPVCARDAAARIRGVFDALVDGPWTRISADLAAMLRSAQASRP